MSIIVSDSGGGDFTPHPEGQYNMVCVDVHDLGRIETKWGPKHKVDLYFYAGLDKHDDETGEVVTDDDGNPVHLFVRSRFTATLDERGNLRPFLERWRGKRFTPEELKGFDLEALIGAGAYVQVVHNEWEGKTFANVDSIMKLAKGQEPDIPVDYVRFCDREDEDEAHEPEPAGAHAGPGMPDDDLPF